MCSVLAIACRTVVVMEMEMVNEMVMNEVMLVVINEMVMNEMVVVVVNDVVMVVIV